jgi:hypothetical protein
MHLRLAFLLAVISPSLFSQQLQLHYDPRHWLDPSLCPKNYPTLFFQYFKTQASDSGLIRPGPFLLQMQCDLLGDNDNIGNFYVQVSQTVRFWRPKIFIEFQYSGGLGIAEPGASGYYITNTYSAGIACPFQWEGTWFSTSLAFAYTAFAAPSRDVRYSLYWWKGLWNYTVDLSGDIQFWTHNRNEGTPGTSNLGGKRVSFYGEPQIWLNISNAFSIGTKINLYYNILTYDATMQVFPTLATRYKLQ